MPMKCLKIVCPWYVWQIKVRIDKAQLIRNTHLQHHAALRHWTGLSWHQVGWVILTHQTLFVITSRSRWNNSQQPGWADSRSGCDEISAFLDIHHVSVLGNEEVMYPSDLICVILQWCTSRWEMARADVLMHRELDWRAVIFNVENRIFLCLSSSIQYCRISIMSYSTDVRWS